MFTDGLSLVFVNDIFEVNLLQIICPWMKNLEAFIFHILISKSLDFFFYKINCGSERYAWILEIIIINLFLRVLDIVRN